MDSTGQIFENKSTTKNIFSTSNKTAEVNKSNSNLQVDQGQQIQELKADKNITPYSKNKQAKKSFFTKDAKDAFVNKVAELNKDSREVRMKERLVFKKELADAVVYINGLKDKNEMFPQEISEVLNNISEYAEINAYARDNSSGEGNLFTRIVGLIKGYFGFFGNRKQIRREYELVRDIPQKIEALNTTFGNDQRYGEVLSKLNQIRINLCNMSGTLFGSQNIETTEERFKRKGWEYDNAGEIDYTNKRIATTADKEDGFFDRLGVTMTRGLNRNDWPLFSHNPTMEDISQGMEGNCWFLSTLASMNSKQIRDMMLDNGDGTVTVRFFREDNTNNKMIPTYIKVDKYVKINGALDCLWVQVLEKAYAAFLQHENKNILKIEKKKKSKKDNAGGNTENVVIAEDVIDYGYVANGGFSNNAFMHFLGEKADKIELEDGEFNEFQHVSTQATIIEAMLWGGKGTDVIAEYDLYRMRASSLDKKIEKLDKELNEKNVGLEVMNAIDIYRKGIKNAQEKLKEEVDENKKKTYEKNIEDFKNAMNELIAKNRPLIEKIESLEAQKITYTVDMDECKAQHEKVIKEKKYSLNGSSIINDDRVVIIDAFIKNTNTIKENIENKIGKKLNGTAWSFISEPAFSLIEDLALKEFFEKMENANPKIIKKGEIEDEIKDKNGVIIRTESLKYVSSENSVYDFEKFFDVCENEIKKEGKHFKQSINDEKFKNVTDKINEVTEKMLKSNKVPEPEIKKILDEMKIDKLVNDCIKNTMNDLIQQARNGIHRVTGIKPKIIEGKYNNRAIGYFKRLEGMLKTEKNVTYSTRNFDEKEGEGTKGKNKNVGMLESHAYTVHKCRELEDGKLMVLLSNPWGTYTVNYKNKDNMLESKAESIGENGLFWIEFNHLLNLGSDFTSGGGKTMSA